MDRFHNIVVPIDFSETSDAAVASAAMLAQLDGASIHLIHAVSFPLVATAYEITVPATVWQSVRESAQQSLVAVQKALEGKGIDKVTAELSNSRDPVQAIEAAIGEHDADLIVMGTHGHSGIKHAFLGSVAERTIRSVDRPVLAVKGDSKQASEPIAKILLAVDFSEHSERAVEITLSIAKRLGASVDLVHAFGLPRDYTPYATHFGDDLEQKVKTCASERLDAIRDRFEAKQVPVMIHFRRGLASEIIAEVAEQIDCQLVVMGTRGNTGMAHILLGSVAERTLRMAPCSVLVAKADSDD